MKKLIAFPFMLLLAASVCGCQSEKQKQQEKELEELRELAKMDRQEMENQYEQFALQYDELKKGIRDDSLIVRLEEERQRTQELLEELRRVKDNDAAEIRRLKKELETVRGILRTYIIQVDSLTRENGRLTSERDEARAMLDGANTKISNLNDERARLSDKVAIASQLNATAINAVGLKSNGKSARRAKDIKRFDVNFLINRNVTANTGERKVYVRMMNPSGGVVNPSGNFSYENKQLECSAVKNIEFTGEEQRVSMVIKTDNDFIAPGQYSIYIFTDGQMIGSSSITLKK